MMLQFQPPISNFSASHNVALSSSSCYSFSLVTHYQTSHKTHKISMLKCSISHTNSALDYDDDEKPKAKWKEVYKRLWTIDSLHKSSSSVLNQCENEGIKLSKTELVRIAKQLRRFRRYKLALQVYEWMSEVERFTVSTSDAAIKLDLLEKVHGISHAEEYFNNLPDSCKDKRVYSSLLNSLAQAKMTEKAENVLTQMRAKEYLNETLPFNVIMTLYMKIKDHNKVETTVLEMKETKTPLDIYSYNIWLASRGSQGSVELMEQVFEEMKIDRTIKLNWTTFCTMATMYVRAGKIKKAEECLKKVEGRIVNKDRSPYHYLLNLHGMVGNKEEVYRIWNIYKYIFKSVPNAGYYAMISALVRLNDIQAAKSLYEEWLLVKTVYDFRIANLLMHWYIRNGFFSEAYNFFEMAKLGGKPTSVSHEILAEGKILEGKIREAVKCLNEAVLARRSRVWRPKAENLRLILEMCEREKDLVGKEAVLGLMRRAGCFDDVAYVSRVGLKNGRVIVEPLIVDENDEDCHDNDDEMIQDKLFDYVVDE